VTELYAGLDVSRETTSVCIVDQVGRMCLEAKVQSEPADLIETLRVLDGAFGRAGLEAGPLSHWLYFGLTDAGRSAVCIETRHLKGAIGATAANKTDRNDARAIVQVVRSGWFKAVHVKSTESQELRTLLPAREFLVKKVRDHENEIRGLLRSFGLKVGRIGAAGFEARCASSSPNVWCSSSAWRRYWQHGRFCGGI
jgi:transposase